MMRKGVTLVEILLAGAILSTVSIGALVCSLRLSQFANDQGELLTADGYCWDVIWQMFNWDFGEMYDLRDRGNPLELQPITVSRQALPALYVEGSPPVCYRTLSNAVDQAGNLLAEGVYLSVNLEWGPSNARKILVPRAGMSATTAVLGHPICVFRSKVSRIPEPPKTRGAAE